MKSEMLYDWWLRDGMINTDRQVDADQDGAHRGDGTTAWRQMLARMGMRQTCDPEYWAARTGDSPTETTRIAMVGQDQEYINLN